MDQQHRAVLRKGSLVAIRDVGPGDREGLLAFLRGLCLDSRTSRFLAPCVDLEHSAALLADVDGFDRYGVLGVDRDGAIVGHAGFARIGARRAEAAVVVADSLRRQGLGSTLLHHIACAASDRGIDSFVAEVLPDNAAIVACIRRSFPLSIRWLAGSRILEFPTTTVVQPAVA
jgi:GNAT superfamily N-acetyltransferase